MRNRIETTIGITVITWLFAGGIAIAQPPVAEFTSDITSGCFPITVNFTDLSTNSPTSWDWDFGNSNGSTLQNPSAVYSAAGFYTVTLIACIGVVCDTIIKTNYISAYNYPIADFTASVTYGCAPLTMQFFDISTPVSSPITSWNWDFGDGFSSTLANPIHTYATPDVYNVSLGIADGLGCTDSKFASNYIIVSTPPTLTYTVDNAYSCTSPLNVTFTNTSTQGTYPVSSWFWLFGDGFSSTNADPVHNYATSGSYTVQLIATDSIGCSILMTDSNAIVVGSDSATFTYTTTRTCTELQVSFFGTSNPNIMSWSWNFGDGSPIQGGQNVSHNYTSSGTFIVTLTTVNVGACPDTSSKVLSYQVTTGSFSTDTTYACSLPFAVSYSGAASGNPPFSYQWDFSYNSFGFNFESSLQNPTYVYTYEDTFDVMMVVTDVFGCTDSISLMGTGDSIWTLVPDPKFTTDPWQGCIPLFVSFTDFSDVGMGSIASWAWNFDDTVSGTNNLSSLQNPTHIFDSIGQYDVTLTITNNLGCSAIEQRLVRSGYPPLADSITTSLAIACHGEPVLLSAFSADTNVNGGIWDYGDGISGGGWPTVIHEFQDTGMLIIEFTPIFNGCEGTPIYDSIYIRPPKPIFTPSPSFICRSPATVTFVNTSWEADNSIWDFGDGSPIEFTVSPVHTFTTPGRHSVLLTVTNANGCRDSLFRSIDIPEPTANFTNTPSIGCVPLKVSFNDASFTYIPISYPIVSWWWDFGDGFTSTVRSPSHTYTTAGIFTVTHVITDNMGCTDTLIKVDEIITSTSTAEFSGTPLVGCEGLTVNFTDLSTQYSPIVAWSWDFGDGSPANSSASPTYSYPTSGTYTVQLTITDSIGCVNTMSKAPYVYITKPNPQFTHPAKTCVDQPISFVNTTSGGGLTFLWDFDDTNTST
ncbi:MAG: PKD domain-containing protein, partial [Flavobacteriales bacterium]|nr:PKD domain-containing protein [Flavobacteriales bacterium]